jgi:TonB-linked SusC/RagA family outer membrane protein
MKKLLMLFSLFLITGALALAQTVQISGTVTSSEDGLPLPGVAVTVKGTTTGVSTGIDGKYIISVPTSAQTLSFQFIGYKSVDVAITGRTTINLVLDPDVLSVDEVVVVGYGSARRIGTVVGSITSVNADKIKEKPVATVLDALQGRVAGLQVYTSSGEPSQLASVRLHGVGSLGASSTPLYILDGVAISSGTMLSLNPNDFESVTVLKDASATSIYGSRAANGVIFITTKSGKTGQNARITVKGQYGFSRIANTDYFENFMNTKQLTDFWVATGYRTQAQVDATLTTYPNDTQWYKFYYKEDAPTYQGDVSISGGGGRTTYFVSGSYFYQDGLAYRSAFDRYSMRANINTIANDWLKFGLNMAAATDSRQTNPYGSNQLNLGLSILRQPFYSPYDADGKEYPDYIPGLNAYNPKYLADKMPSVSKRTQADISGNMSITPVKNLIFKTQVGLNAFDLVGTSKRMPSYIPNINNGTISESFQRYITGTITNTAEYKMSIDGVHNLTFLVGQEGIVNDNTAFDAYAAGLTDDRLMLLGVGTAATRTVSSSRSEFSYLSYFGRVDYGFGEKYFVDFSLRQDASSRFGADNRTARFWAAGAMWNAKKETFLETVTFLSALNVNASIGTSGNSEIGDYNHLALIGTNTYDGGTGWSLSSPGNPALGWEQQTKTTVGLRFALLDNRYRFKVEYYNRITSNMLISIPFPYTSGWSDVTSNVGKLQNTGVDIEFDFDVVRSNNFYVTPYFNFNYNKNEVLELFQGNDYWIIPNTGVCWAVGQPVSYFYPLFAGIDPDDGSPMWYVPGENIVETTKETTTKTFSSTALQQNISLPRHPPMVGGFGLNAGYKGFAFQADFAFALKKYMINNDRYFTENPTQFAGYNQSLRVLDYWKQPGDVTLFPRYQSGLLFTQFDSRLVENASFMRMKNLSVSYTVPKNVLDKTGFVTGARVYFTGRNLLTFTNYLGPDPEVDSNIGLGTNPNTKQFTFGIELNF